MRKYEHIWKHIKEAPPDKWVAVNLASASMMQTIINMVQVEKSAAQVARRDLDLPQFGKLVILREPEKKRVSFKLKNSGDV
jgi:hypothetical protein